MHLLFDSSWVRAILRVYFVFALLLVAWFGDKCLHQRTKLKLLRGEQVQVTSMTGWLRGPVFMKTALQIRRLPGGFIGIFMILTAILALLSDLAVSVFVKTVSLQSRCPFYSGLRIDGVPSQYPSNVGTPALWATTAQSQSAFNGGLLGIYYKTDNSGNFSAEAVDVAANWTCVPDQDISYQIPKWSDEGISVNLMNRNLLFPDVYNHQNVSITGSDMSTQTVIWTTDAKGSNNDTNFSNVPSGVWNARFAVDVLDTKDEKFFRIYDCKLEDYTTGAIVTNVVAQIDIVSTMPSWLNSIQGKLWDDFDSPTPVPDPAIVLAWMLNTLTMVSGSTNRISYTSDETQGCLRPFTTVPWPVLVCVGIAACLLIIFTTYLACLVIKVRIASRKYDRNALITTPGGTPVPSKEIRNNTPNGLLDWMQHAVHESGTTEKMPRTHHLSKWLFSTRHHGGRRLGVISKHMSSSAVSQYFAQQNGSPGGLTPSTPETQAFVPRPSPRSSSYFPRKPVPSADYSAYQQLPKHDYEVGVVQVRPSP